MLKGQDVFVNGSKLHQIIGEARAKGPLYLLQKLIPEVFSTDELAQSCGQGIGNSNSITEDKRPLDRVKTKVLKGTFIVI